MMHIKRIAICLFSLLIFVQSLITDGFLAGTLVKTATGFLPIEDLYLGDEVFCFDRDNAYTIQPITYITTEVIDHYIQLSIDNTYLNSACDQLLYLPQEQKWIDAQHLTTNHVLLGYNEQLVYINTVGLINKTVTVYKVTVSGYHTLCVSSRGITAHNFFPLIALGIGFAFGTGAVECAVGLTAGIGILGSVIGIAASKQIGKNKKNYITPTIDSIGSCTPGYSFQEQKDNDDKTGAQAPGKPAENDGYVPPKNWDGKKVKNPNGSGYGWPDKDGNVWIPSGPKGHGGPHWDVQNPKTKRHRNIFPGGKER